MEAGDAGGGREGNRAALRIPTSVLEAAQLRLDQPIDVCAEGSRIVIEPIPPAKIGAFPSFCSDQ